MHKLKTHVNLPNISAESWCILDPDAGAILIAGKNADQKRQVASLTKMMTFYVAWNLQQRLSPQASQLKIQVPAFATKVIGTRAKLRHGDALTIQQLFYALLLPSGNDAALVLADFFGNVLRIDRPKENQ